MNKITAFVFACLLATGASSPALAAAGGEGNNTGCNGVGNPNSPCGGSGGTETPPPIVVTGPQGPKGDPGRDGINGRDGANGVAGKDGTNGVAGADGKDGAQGKTGAVGAVGATGAAGRDGKDATLPADIVTKAQLDGAVQQINGRIDQVDRKASAGSATAVGIASIPQAVDPGSNIIGVGAGYYSGESALAIGVSRRSDDGQWITKLSAGVNSRGSAAVGVGAALVWK